MLLLQYVNNCLFQARILRFTYDEYVAESRFFQPQNDGTNCAAGTESSQPEIKAPRIKRRLHEAQ
jgi:hypothetical protein